MVRRRLRLAFGLGALVLLFASRGLVAADGAPAAQLHAYEEAVAAHPEDLALAADYRQLAIAAGAFDRPIAFLDKLARRKDGGPNILISLALAYVDKVPIAGEIRRAYIGRAAMAALTRAIAVQPSVLAYYIRGRINLGYDAFIFHRTDKGIADLSQALTLVTPSTPSALVALVYVALGDAYYKADDQRKAQQLWSAGADRFPDNRDLRIRLSDAGAALRDLVHGALSPGRRVDTSLRGLLPVR